MSVYMGSDHKKNPAVLVERRMNLIVSIKKVLKQLDKMTMKSTK
jgi:hypothetical protein